MRVNHNSSLICSLERQTQNVRRELAVRDSLQKASEQYAKAAMELREANLTFEERQAKDAEIRRGQIAFSRIVPENHPDWREEASATFKARKL